MTYPDGQANVLLLNLYSSQVSGPLAYSMAQDVGCTSFCLSVSEPLTRVGSLTLLRMRGYHAWLCN